AWRPEAVRDLGRRWTDRDGRLLRATWTRAGISPGDRRGNRRVRRGIAAAARRVHAHRVRAARRADADRDLDRAPGGGLFPAERVRVPHDVDRRAAVPDADGCGCGVD